MEEMLDVTSEIEIGMDENGQAVVSLQAAPCPRSAASERRRARHIAQSLLEILNSPRDVRTSLGGH
jgi:hypothetical protein